MSQFVVAEHGTLELDDQQKVAVVSPLDGAALVLAGAGSGKTRVLTMRVAWLIQHGADPKKILATTFSRKAADEMKERLETLVGASAVRDLTVNTIHGACLGILTAEGLAKDLISYSEQRGIIEDALEPGNVNWDVGWKYPLYWISRMKMSLVLPEKSEWRLNDALSRVAPGYVAHDLAQKIARVYRIYEREKGLINRMDFDDMIMWVGLRLEDDEAFRRKWQDRIDYVLVDELQDTSRLSVKILETLAAPEMRIFGCADDFQSLYQWNLADPQHNVFGFLDRVPGKLLKIETNYRSTKRIVALGNALACTQYANNGLFKKDLVARPGASDGAQIELSMLSDVYEEAAWVVDNYQALELQPRDVFVLYRMNCQSRAVEDELVKRGIPYIVQGSLGFYDRAVVKDVLAYMRLVENEHNDEAFKRVANMASIWHDKHYRGFGQVFYRACAEAGKSLWAGMLAIRDSQTKFKRQGIGDLVGLIDAVRHEGDHEAVQTVQLIREYCYDTYLRRKEGIPEGDEDTQAFDDLNELLEAAKAFPTNKQMLEHVDRVIAMKEAQGRDLGVDVVVLSTIHRVKGLERPVVFGIGMVEGILPHWRSDPSIFPDLMGRDELPVEDTSGIPQERCAAYVLVTRARERLFLSGVCEWRGRAVVPSRFLREMGLEVKNAERDCE
jgi:DNA helicase-2/ATP-dependent DNA helicase PcrA